MGRIEYTERDYAGAGDLPALKAFLCAARAAGLRGYMHPGDLLWHTHMHVQKNPRRDFRLWLDGRGTLAGFVEFTPPSGFEMQIAPDLRGRGVLEPAMTAWARAHSAQFGADGRPPATLSTSAIASDAQSAAWLEANGFARDAFEMFVLERDLADVPGPVAGANVRHVAGEAEFAERVSIHREVWDPSKVTLEGYRLTRSAPGYDPELDLVAVLADGSFGAYCIAWRDDANGIGEFEPVGTRVAQRRKGYGAAVMVEGMRRLRAKGMRMATVYCMAENLVFYGSLGFNVMDRYVGYTKTF